MPRRLFGTPDACYPLLYLGKRIEVGTLLAKSKRHIIIITILLSSAVGTASEDFATLLETIHLRKS